MLNLIDSFIEMLATELALIAGAPPVHWVRVTTDQTANRTKMGYLNIAVLGFFYDGPTEEALVSLDLIGSDERAVLTQAQIVRDKLLEGQYTPEFNYASNPGSPTALGKMVSWEGDKVSFNVVATQDNYVHLNATFPVQHVRF